VPKSGFLLQTQENIGATLNVSPYIKGLKSALAEQKIRNIFFIPRQSTSLPRSEHNRPLSLAQLPKNGQTLRMRERGRLCVEVKIFLINEEVLDKSRVGMTKKLGRNCS